MLDNIIQTLVNNPEMVAAWIVLFGMVHIIEILCLMVLAACVERK